MRKTLLVLWFAPGLLLATANYVYHGPTETSDNPSGHKYRNGVVNNSNIIYDNEATTIAVKVEYNGWITDVKIAYTTNGADPTFTDNTTALDWWGNGTSDGTGEPQVWGKSSVIPQQSAGTTVKYILFAYHTEGGDVIYANGGNDGFHNDVGEATVFSFTVLDDASLPVELSSFNARSSSTGVELTWTTDSEIENQGFILSRKNKGGSWTEIASFANHKALQGQGSTTRTTDYVFVDAQVREGSSYSYQLSDLDYSGQLTDHTDQVQTIIYVNPGEDIRPHILDVVKLYPNPFNPDIKLVVDIHAQAPTRISIFNLQGQEIAVLENDELSPGRYDYQWQGSGQPSGIYFVRIQAGQYVRSEKISLLK